VIFNGDFNPSMMAWLRFSAFFQMMALSLANLIPLFWSKSLGFNPEQIGFIIGVANFVAIVAPLFFGSFGGIRPVFWILICFGGHTRIRSRLLR
jgi:MFS family permease